MLSLASVHGDLSLSDSWLASSTTKYIAVDIISVCVFFVPFSGIDFLLSSVTPLLPVWIVGLHKCLSHTQVIADMILLLVTLSCLTTTHATLHNFLELGALPDDLSDIAAWHNGRLLNDTLAELQPGQFLKFNHSLCLSLDMATFTMAHV